MADEVAFQPQPHPPFPLLAKTSDNPSPSAKRRDGGPQRVFHPFPDIQQPITRDLPNAPRMAIRRRLGTIPRGRCSEDEIGLFHPAFFRPDEVVEEAPPSAI